MIADTNLFREYIDQAFEKHPELFPTNISQGYHLHGFTKPSVKIKGMVQIRIKTVIDGEQYTIAPSFILPYMRGKIGAVENALFLMKYDVPFSALTHVFGRNDMYWYRLHNSWGRNSIVGTTIKSEDKLPKNLAADEKHSKLKKDKVYLPITVGQNCILGSEVSKTADGKDLEAGYGVFVAEAKNISEDYTPETINTDGWAGTNTAWKALYSNVVIILCFLHSYLKIRKTCRKTKETLNMIKEKVWDAYLANNKRSFSQRLRRLREWAQTFEFKADSTKSKILKLCSNVNKFSIAYDHVNCLRTSNMADRLMRFISESLVNRQYFHSNIESATLWTRSRAILHNFTPICPRRRKKMETGLVCPASRLNGFSYSDNWLENLVVSTSMRGYRQ